MNSCHVCTSIPKKDQIIACDNCEHNYCLKCIKIHLNEPSIQKTFLICNFDTIKQKKNTKSWLCFSCNKQCLCIPCKGTGLVSVEKQLLGKKQPALVKRKFEDFQKFQTQIELFKNVNFSQLSSFQQEYFMNKAMLYCSQHEAEITGNRIYGQSQLKQGPQRIPMNQNVIEIDSEQNGEDQQPIEEQVNQEIQQKPQVDDQMELQNQEKNEQERKNPEVMQVDKSNERNDKIEEEPKKIVAIENALQEVQAPATGNEGTN